MIIAVGSWRGIGATTTALLAATVLAEQHGEAWLIEADPAGGVLAGRLSLPPHAVGGLERVAFPADRSAPLDDLFAVAHPLGRLQLVTAPADPFRAHACHLPRAPWPSALRQLDAPVVVDIGRLRGGTAAWPVLTLADSVLLVAAPEVAAAVAAAEWIDAAGRVSPADPGLPGRTARVLMVDSPGGIAFSEASLRHDLAGDWGGWLPWEPTTVDLVLRGAGPHDRRVRRSALLSAMRDVVATLAPSRPTVATFDEVLR